MRLTSLRIRHFRSIADQNLSFDALTALVGANGVGKSSFLRALEYFYANAPTIDTEDFYAEDVTQPIVIAATFAASSDEEREVFAPYLDSDAFTVTRTFPSAASKAAARYYGSVLRHTAFQPVRAGLEIKDRGATARPPYDALRADPAYPSLPAWTTLKAVEPALREWEKANPEKCTKSTDDGVTIGFGSQFPCNLSRYTRLLYVPAVRDAAVDAGEGRGSILSSLMDLLVRKSLSQNPRLERIRSRTQALYKNALSEANQPQLTTLAASLTATLRTLVPDSAISLEWLDLPALEIPLPSAVVTLVEDGYAANVQRTGHGLQRAFIITLLQHLTSAQSIVGPQPAEGAPAQEGPDLVLAIEEPELFQHPNRQRHFAKTLHRLAYGKLEGLAAHTQVVYATHSPLFVGLDRIANLRLLKRAQQWPAKPKTTTVLSADLAAVARTVWEADGSKGVCFTEASLLPRLRTIMSPLMGEGFFARSVVLVEGEDDRAALLGVAEYLEIDLEAAGVAIIPAGGKTNLDRPYAIFSALGIPVYPVWDGDFGVQKAKPEDNHRLLRLLHQAIVDWPQTTVTPTYTCFSVNLETTLQEEIGKPLFDQLLGDCQAAYGIPKRHHALKNPAVLGEVIGNAYSKGASCPSLKGILDATIAQTS